MFEKAPNAKALLDAVPGWDAQRDLGLLFSRIQLLRRQDQAAEAAQLILSLPNDPAQAIDADQWWIERRLIARKLIDLDDPRTAYHVADGGYYDNFGIVTLIEWARKLVRIPPTPRLLIVEIRQSDNKAYRSMPPKDRAGWTYETIGPLSTMMKVRESSQATRNDLDIELLTEWARAHKWTVESVVFTLAQNSPMSWHLSDDEISRIQAQWAACKARPDSAIAKAWNSVRALFPPAETTAQAVATNTTAVDPSACGEPIRATTSVARVGH